MAESSLNALPGLLLFILGFICIFPACPIGGCGFYLSCSSFLGDKIFSLSLMVFGEQIGDLYKSYFIGRDFSLSGGVVYVQVVDSMCVVPWTTTVDLSLFVTSCHWVGACWNLVECSFFQVLLKLGSIIWFQLDQFLYQSSILLVLIDWIHLLCNRRTGVFSHVGPYYFSCFQESYIPLMHYF